MRCGKTILGIAHLSPVAGDRAMNGKALFTGILLLAGLFSPTSPAFS